MDGGTRELHASKEGFTFHRPTRAQPCFSKPAFVCGKPSTTSGEHFDQRASDAGLQCIQSSTCLVDQGELDGCFLCWPGSFRHHRELTAETYRGRFDWVPLTEADEVDED